MNRQTAKATPDLSDSTLQLVLALLQARFDPRDVHLDTDLRSTSLQALQLAGEHGVAPALAEGLRQLIRCGLPWQDLQPIFEAVEVSNAQKNATLRRAALSIAQWLDTERIEAVFLKGAAFILEDETDAAWRTTTDLDILVPAEDVARAAEALRANGYRFAMDPSAYRPHLHHHYAPLVNDQTKTFVELHTRLMQDEADDLVCAEEICLRKQTVCCHDQAVSIPCPEHRMIHLIAHAQISNWGYPLRKVWLKDVLDAVELARGQELNWTDINEAFATIGATAQLDGFLAAAENMLGLAVPVALSRPQSARAWAEASIEAISIPERAGITTMRILSHYLQLFARNPARLSIIWQTLRDPARLQLLFDVNRQRTG